MSKIISFTVLGKPQAQGSMRGFVVAGKARITSDNENLKPWRQEVGWAALRALDGREQPFARKHTPVSLMIRFHFKRPESVPKKRTEMVVKPDLDKLVRAACDAMTGIMWHDDAQIVSILAEKYYAESDFTEFTVSR